VAAGPDGNLWFTDGAAGGRIHRAHATPSLTLASFPLPTSALPRRLTGGFDGNLWFSEEAVDGGHVGRVTPAGIVTQFTLPPAFQTPSIVPALGAVWQASPDALYRTRPEGQVTVHPFDDDTAAYPERLASSPDGLQLYGVFYDAAEYAAELWIASGLDGTLLYPPLGGLHPQVEVNIGDLAVDRAGNLWYATRTFHDAVGNHGVLGLLAFHIQRDDFESGDLLGWTP
jgi:streptogramin lyase